MFTLHDKDRMLDKREAVHKARCGLADSLDVLGLMLTLPVKEKAEKVHCYCNLKGKNALFVAFYTAGDNAVLFSDELGKAESMELNMAVMSQLVYLKSQYEDCPELMPCELFMDFDPVSRKAHVLAGMDNFTDPNEVSIRSLVWFKEHGGKLKRSAELAMKMRFKAQAEAARNPASKATELDVEALELSRSYVAGEIEDPAISNPETTWDFVRTEINRVYRDAGDPMSFESDDGESWIDVYDSRNCWQYVSFGLHESIGAEYTLSLKKMSNQDKDDAQIFALLNLMREAVAKAQSEKALLPEYSYMKLEGAQAGFICVPETKLKTVESPSGSIALRKLVYITGTELQALENGSLTVEALYKKTGDICDYAR